MLLKKLTNMRLEQENMDLIYYIIKTFIVLKIKIQIILLKKNVIKLLKLKNNIDLLSIY